MKKTLLIAFLLIASYAWAYDGFVVIDSGDTLYFNIREDSTASITFPNYYSHIDIDAGIYFDTYYYQHTMPSGHVTIPDSVTYQGLRYSVSTIGQNAFYGCQQITSITVPNTIVRIENWAFQSCTSLDTINWKRATPPSINYDAYVFPHAGIVFNIPCGSYPAYNNYNVFCNYHNCWEYPYHEGILSEPDVELPNLFVSADNDTVGRVEILRDIYCDSTVVIFAGTLSLDYHFDHWSNGRTANPDTLHLTGDSTIIAFFEPNHYLYTLHVRTVDSTLGDVVIEGYEEKLVVFEHIAFDEDTAIIVATPTEHYHLVYWDVVDTYGYGRCYDNPHRVVFGYNREDYSETFTAHFAIDTHAVSVASSDIARGRVEGGGLFEYGTPCTVAAEAYSGYHFSHWSNGATYNPYTFAVLEDTELTAVFLAEGEVGIGDVNANDINVYSFGGRIVVVGTTDEVRVFDMTGRSVRNEALPAGVYMVKIGERPARKVVVMR